MQGGQYDSRLGFSLQQLAGRFESVALRHHEIHHDHVGMQVLCRHHHCGSVRCLAAHNPLGHRLQDIAQQHTHGLMIVGNQDS